MHSTTESSAPVRPARRRIAGLLAAGAPLAAAVALAGAPMLTSTPVAATGRPHAVVGLIGCDAAATASGLHRLKFPECAGD